MLSSSASSPAGISQGTVILLMLFNVHIDYLEDGIPNHINVNTSKYADDCTHAGPVGVGDSSHIQESVDAVLIWAELNKMVINVKKTKDTWLCFTDSILETPPIQINGELIERVNTFKLLGV